MEVHKNSQSYIWLFVNGKALLKISVFYHYKLVPVFLYLIILEGYKFLVCIHVLGVLS